MRLVHIEYSVKGKRDLLKPGRVGIIKPEICDFTRKTYQNGCFLDLKSSMVLVVADIRQRGDTHEGLEEE